MKVYNQDKTQILNEYDLELGHLENDTLHISEVKEIKEQGHYETVVEYPNGGKDVKWIVDIPGVKHQEARDEKILVYIPYTEQEIKEKSIYNEIDDLKQRLFETDYQAIKFAEGVMTLSEYEPMREKRKQWRERINFLENFLKNS